MTSDRRVVLRDPTSADLYRGGRNLLNLLDGMSEQNLNLAQAALGRYLARHPDAAQPPTSSQQEGRTT